MWQHRVWVCWIDRVYMTTSSDSTVHTQIKPPDENHDTNNTPSVHSHQSQITLTVLLQSRTMTLVRNHNSWILTLLVSSRSSSRFLSIITFWRITACCKKTKTTSTDSIEIKIICYCSHCTCTSICVDSLNPKTYCKTILLNNPRILKSVNLILNWFLS